MVRRPEEIDVSISVRSCFFSYSDSGTKAGKLRFEDMLVLGHGMIFLPFLRSREMYRRKMRGGVDFTDTVGATAAAVFRFLAT